VYTEAKGLSVMPDNEVTEIITSVLSQYPIKRAALFGSFSRGDYSDASDVDVIVDFSNEIDLADNFFSLYDDLEERLGRKVDLLRYETVANHMKPRLRQNVLKDLRWFYEA
jgi:predicted nucleotidyltransferase